MSKNRISKNEAIEIANEFYSQHFLRLTRKKQEFNAIRAKKSFIEPNCWEVCYQLISEERNVIDGPIFILVHEEKSARFI